MFPALVCLKCFPPDPFSAVHLPPSWTSRSHPFVSLSSCRYWHLVGLFILTHFWPVTHHDDRRPAFSRNQGLSSTLPFSNWRLWRRLTWWVSLFKPNTIPFTTLASSTNNIRCQTRSTLLQLPIHRQCTPHLKEQASENYSALTGTNGESVVLCLPRSCTFLVTDSLHDGQAHFTLAHPSNLFCHH